MKKSILCMLLLSFSVVAKEEASCDINCTFVMKEQGGKKVAIVNGGRAKQAFTPYSTFKIPNTLIALDTGIVKDTSQKLSFDIDKYPLQKWWPEIWYKEPLVIRTAFQKSAVPIYQQIATEVGRTRMQDYLTQFRYGNHDISSGLDTFWLNGSIKISAIQQVDFLQRLYSGELRVSEQALNTFKKVMLVEQTEEYTLYAKTGGGPLAKDKALGWYVGIIDKGEEVYYFALNIEGRRFSDVKDKRIDAAMNELRRVSVL